jgi:hypothetical protein
LYRERYAHYGHGSAEQAIVGLGCHVYMRRNSQDAVREFRPHFDRSPVMGGGMSMEEYMEQTPLTVGTPDQVIEKTLTFREYAGDYQRQLFMVDGGGVPLKAVLEQLDMLGEGSCPSCGRSSPRTGRPRCPTPSPMSRCAPPTRGGRSGVGRKGGLMTDTFAGPSGAAYPYEGMIQQRYGNDPQ